MRRAGEHPSEGWPRVFDLRPGLVVLAVCVFVALAWASVLAVDIVRVVPGRPPPELWPNLFNDRPVEYLQWIMLPTTAALAAYLSARMPDPRVAAFLLVFAAALTLMFIEDAGDIRHHLELDEIGIWGFFQMEMVYFAAIASVPIYALVRYGRDVWRFARTRGYLVVGYVLYGMAATGAAFSARIYRGAGQVIDETFFRGRFPVQTLDLPEWVDLHEGAAAEWSHYSIMDGLIEESIETIAVACFLATVLTLASYARRGAAGTGAAPRR